MKTLYLNAIVALPDSFSGTFDDAVRYYLEERASNQPLGEFHHGSVSLRVNSHAFELNKRYGFSMVSDGGVYALRHNGWVRLDKNPEVCYSQGDIFIK